MISILHHTEQKIKENNQTLFYIFIYIIFQVNISRYRKNCIASCKSSPLQLSAPENLTQNTAVGRASQYTSFCRAAFRGGSRVQFCQFKHIFIVNRSPGTLQVTRPVLTQLQGQNEKGTALLFLSSPCTPLAWGFQGKRLCFLKKNV